MPLTDAWNDPLDETVDEDQPKYRPCHRCHGSGEDADGADCLFCDGFGDHLI